MVKRRVTTMEIKNNWKTLEDADLTTESLAALMNYEIPAIRIRNFATQEECRSFAKAVESYEFAYSPKQDPPIGRLGLTQFGHFDQPKENYFAAVEEAYRVQRAIMDESFDPVTRMLELLREVARTDVAIAEEAGLGPYFAGLIRTIHVEAGLHFDWTLFEAPGWGVQSVDPQLAWNLFVSPPPTGGECVIYDRRWEPEDEKTKDHESDIVYNHGLLAGRLAKTIPPTCGDVVLINTRNYHEVKRGDGDRLTVSSFIGRQPAGNLVLWS
jgi:hypothetical protein